VFDFDGFLLSLRNAVGEVVLPMLEWDIRIADINDVKQDLLISGTLSGAERFRWLTNSMPRYLWRATGSSDRGRVFDILLDATDIHTNDGVHAVVNYDPALATLLATVASNPRTDGLVAPLPGARKIIGWFRQTASVGL
jgi:plasmid stabilization system protein ParE